jgi:hypothetical protein
LALLLDCIAMVGWQHGDLVPGRQSLLYDELHRSVNRYSGYAG